MAVVSPLMAFKQMLGVLMEASRRAFLQDASLAAVASLISLHSRPSRGDIAAPSSQLQDIFYDHDGLIVHHHPDGSDDGGDTAQREGWYWLGVWIRSNILGEPWTAPRPLNLSFPDVLKLLEPGKDGVFYRHPKLPPWNNPYDNKYGFTRDQMTPLVAAMGVWNQLAPLSRLWDALPQDAFPKLKHTFNNNDGRPDKKLIYSGDPVDPQTVNLFRRARGEDPTKVSNNDILDLINPDGSHADFLLNGNAGSRTPAFLEDRDDTGVDLNLIVLLLMSILRFPSVESAQAVNTYAKNRLVSYGSFVSAYRQHYGVDILSLGDLGDLPDIKDKLDRGIESNWPTDASRVYGAVRWYHRPGKGANPQLAELYAPIIRRYLE